MITQPGRLPVVLLCTLIAVAAAAAGTVDDGDGDVGARVDALLSRYHEHDLWNGTALVVVDDEVVLRKSYGPADRTWDRPNTPETRSRIGSITKSITALAVLTLVRDGRIDLDAPVHTYLPEWDEAVSGRITVRHLLAHTSGLPPERPSVGLTEYRQPLTWDDFMQGLNETPLRFDPGTGYTYSNVGYYVLGLVIEAASGREYEGYVRDAILDPLRLDDTGFALGHRILPGLAEGYEALGAPGLYRKADWMDLSWIVARGNMISTVDDLRRLDLALRGDDLLPDDLRTEAFTPGPGRYGLGWWIREWPIDDDGTTRTVIEHSGVGLGYRAIMVRIPEDRSLIVLLGNSEPIPTKEIAETLFRSLYRDDEPLPDPPPTHEILSLLFDEGLDAALARYRELQAQGTVRGRGFGPEQLVGPPDAIRPTRLLNGWIPTGATDVDTARVRFDPPRNARAVELVGTDEVAAFAWIEVVAADGTRSTLPLDGAEHEAVEDGITTHRVPFPEPMAVAGIDVGCANRGIEGNVFVDAIGVVAGDGVRYWATDADASSTLAGAIPTGVPYAAHQLNGPPDVTDAASYRSGWISASEWDQEWVHLGFRRPVTAVAIEIHGVERQGGLTRVRGIEPDGTLVEVPPRVAASDSTTDGLGWIRVAMPSPKELVGVHLDIDSSRIDGQNLIDAVALVDAAGAREWVWEATVSSSLADARRRTGAPGTGHLLEIARALDDQSRRDDGAAVRELADAVWPVSR